MGIDALAWTPALTQQSLNGACNITVQLRIIGGSCKNEDYVPKLYLTAARAGPDNRSEFKKVKIQRKIDITVVFIN